MNHPRWIALAILVLSGCRDHPTAASSHGAYCPVGAVRIDPPAYSGGAEIGEGFRSVAVAEGIAAYRDDMQNGNLVQCAFVCATGSIPEFKRDKLVCTISH